MKVSIKSYKVVIFFGGPSNERNISLDSARTFYDSIRHYLTPKNLTLVFVSKDKNFYLLNPEWIYSNTIDDFEDLFIPKKTKEFRQGTVSAQSNHSTHANIRAGYKLSSRKLNQIIDKADGLFPLIHGAFGEDGELTKMLQKRGRKAILGSSPPVLYESLKKNLSHWRLADLGFKTYEYCLIKKIDWVSSPNDVIKKIRQYFNFQRGFDVVVKPNDCGSSDGVSMVYDYEKISEAVDHAFLFSDEVLIEEKIYGREFSIILIEDNGIPLSLFPTEIVLKKKYKQDNFYSRQKKYMPGNGVDHITPANFSKDLIEKIRFESETIFKKFGFNDWARFDGFLLSDGSVIWSDLNSIPGIGQDGILFQQSIYLGIDTFNFCYFILTKVLKKEGKVVGDVFSGQTRRQKIGVLGGGSTSERQVSRMSWCNVIEKLDRLQTYQLKYLFMDKKNKIWLVPRSYTLKHTTEEIERLIKNSSNKKLFPTYEKVYRRVKQIFPKVQSQNFDPQLLTLSKIKKLVDYLFNCLHGGIGENGSLQKECEKISLPFNGSGSKISRLTFDKTFNHQLLRLAYDVEQPCLISMPEQISFDLDRIKKALHKKNWDFNKIQIWATKILEIADNLEELKKIINNLDYRNFAKIVIECTRIQIEEILHLTNSLGGKNIRKLKDWDSWKKGKKIIKPTSDGCSTGVVVCNDFSYQLPLYLLFSFSRYRFLPASLFELQIPIEQIGQLRYDKKKMLRLPNSNFKKLICEEFLGIEKKFIELTVGVVGRKGSMISMLPSKTVAEWQILSLDEKFNKGVGPNLTPPRELTSAQINSIRQSVAVFANRIGLKDYARLDLFYNLKDEGIYLIEVNTLPGLTAATILFTQAQVTPGLKMPPSEFLKQIIDFTLNPNENVKKGLTNKKMH